MNRGGYERVRLLDAAVDDLRAIAHQHRDIAVETLRLLKQLDQRQLTPTPLRHFNKTGDLSDCAKIVVSVPDRPEYRIVVREVGDHLDVVEVVVVEQRADDLAYLLAGVRRGRIHDPVRRSDTQRRIQRLQKRTKPDP